MDVQYIVSVETIKIILENHSETMADWVHCNSCFTRYKSSIKFNFTSCGHVFCDKCLLEMGNKNSCAICHAQFQSIPISNNLDPQLECFFRPPQVHLEKSKQILNFQQSNAISLIKYITQKYNYAKTEILRLYKSNKELKKENEKLNLQVHKSNKELKEENEILKLQLSIMSNRSGESNSRKAPSNFSMGTDETMIFKKYQRPVQPPPYSLWSQHGVERPMGIQAVEAVSSFESQDVSAACPPRGSGLSIIHYRSFKRVRLYPMLPMPHLHLRSGKGNPEQKYKR